MLRAILLFFIIFLSYTLKAAHLKGGYIEYEYLGASLNKPGFTSYNVTVFQYLDCNSAGGQIDESIILGVFNISDNSLKTSFDIGLSGSSIIQKQSFVCIDNPPVVCYRIDSYNAVIDVENSAAGYILSVQRCCRIPGINNVFNSSNTGVTYTIKLYPSASGNGFMSNSSPIFSQEDTALVCANNGFTFPFKAVDPDGDSLVYRFSAGLNTPSREAKPNPPLVPPFPNLSYVSGFNAGQPLGNKVTINRNTGIISGIAPSAAGDYVVAVEVDEYRNGIKIAETRKELHLAVGNCNIPRAILPDNITNCNDFNVLFENQSAASGINSYFWDFGDSKSLADTSSAARPTYVYSDTGVYKAKLIVNPGGVCPDSMVTDVRIFPGFSADFDLKGVCNQLPYQFTDLSKTTYGVIDKYRWDFGESSITTDTSNIKNPVYTYNNVNTYQVTLVVSSSKGCMDTVTKSVSVSDKPVINLAFRDTVICIKDSLQLIASGPGNYSWSPATNMINPTSATPVVFPKTSTIYFVELNNSDCIARDSVKVRVVSSIAVNAGNDTTICRGDFINLFAVSDANVLQWTPATGLDSTNIKNPRAAVTGNSITYTVNASLGSCLASDAITILTQPYPVVNAGVDTIICFGQGATLKGSSTATLLQWQPSNKVANSTSAVTATSITSSQSFILTARFNSGCTKPVSDTVLVNVIPKITVSAGNDTTLVVGETMILNGTTNATNFNWSPATGLNNQSAINPVLVVSPDMVTPFSQYLKYTITASVNQGCSASDDIIIRIFDKPSIFVPSGFTPNTDGLNDVIRPILAGIKTFDYFRVYNRYGQLVFETKTPGAGWNGSIKGQPQSSGAYVYECRATDYTGQKRITKGNFVLIR
ncbi:MAG: PKD domain-containing protein [Bacteroidota bacterium]